MGLEKAPWKTLCITFVTVYGLLHQYPQLLEYKVYFLVAGSLLLQYWPMRHNSDPYGLFHLSLNKLPGEPADRPPETEWLNMGYWKNTSLFPKACEALAMETITASRMSAGARVLDVGYGTGESTITLLSHPSVPRPSVVRGITSMPMQHARSQSRVTSWLQSSKGYEPKVDLQEGDAVYDGKQVNHPLDPSTPDRYDTILAIDCAYHFNTREKFLNQSFQKLAPGGRIALADICLDLEGVHSFPKRLFLSLVRLMPKHNMISIAEYKTQMAKAGYTDIEIRDISTDVFPSFLAFLKGRGFTWKCFAWVLGGYVSSGAHFVIASGSKSKD